MHSKGPSSPSACASPQQVLLSAALGGAATDDLQEGQLPNPKARTPGLLPPFKGGFQEDRMYSK